MKLYGLFGVSGSGKSYHAAQIAKRIEAEWIIDDGLLIHHDQIVAGFSAKFELNKIASIRRAVFTEEAHRDEVRNVLTKHENTVILILGTSQKMIRTIAERLMLTGEMTWLDIRELSNEGDISTAAKFRAQGMHAIPVSKSHLVQPFAPSFLRRILRNAHLLRQAGNNHEVKRPSSDYSQTTNTIVYPVFTSGAIFVHPYAIRDSVKYLLGSSEHPFTLKSVHCDTHSTDIHVHVEALWNREMRVHANHLQSEIHHYLQNFLGFPYAKIYIHIDSILPPMTLQQRGHWT